MTDSRLPPPAAIEKSVMAAFRSAGLDATKYGALAWRCREPARVLDTLRRQQRTAGRLELDAAGVVVAAARDLGAALDAAGLTVKQAARLGMADGDDDGGPIAEIVRIATTPRRDGTDTDTPDVGSEPN